MLLLLFLLSAFVYVAPTIIVISNDHPKAFPIMMLNLLFGWTVIGWLAALWAAVHPSKVAKRQELPGVEPKWTPPCPPMKAYCDHDDPYHVSLSDEQPAEIQRLIENPPPPTEALRKLCQGTKVPGKDQC